MFQKKPVYIIGIVLFTLILIGDLLIFFLVPTDSSRGTMPDMGGSFDPGSFSGELPDGLPSDNGGSQRPDLSGWDPGDFSDQQPEGFDRSELPGRGQTDTAPENRLLTAIGSAFWPILIVCVLGDGLCVFMLIRISRKTGTQQTEEPAEEDPRTSRRDHTNTWLAIIALLLAGAVAMTSLPSGASGAAMEAELSVLQAQATTGDLASVFSGSGTLLSSDADTIQLPEWVKVTSYTVQNGDTVQSGDVIAYVDKNSVQKALYQVQTLIDELDEELSQVQTDTLEQEITARADGRVKAIYVEQGDSIAAAMQEHGAVILISLGGSMCVNIESDEAVSVGQALTVTLSDQTQIEGKVQQVRDGTITVTTSDQVAAPDDTVSVATQEGTVLGTGTLSVASPLRVTGFWGSVDKIRVRVNDTVETGDTLLTLENTEDLARYQQLLRQRQELTALAGELAVMYQDGTVRASAAGVISQVDTEIADFQPAAESGAESSSQRFSASSSSGTDDPPPSETDTPPAEVPDAGQSYTNGTYAGKVTKVAYGALYIKICQIDMTGSSIEAAATMEDALFTLQQQYTPSLQVPVNLYQDGQTVPGTINGLQAGDTVLLRIEDGDVVQIDYIPGAGVSGPSQGADHGGSMMPPSAGGSFGYTPSASESEDTQEAVYEVTTFSLCAIAPAQTMTVDILVDELDILSLAVGQEATVTLDALPGQNFAGTVKKINTAGTNQGGSTKYTVTMEVPRTAQMLDGMNASVLIQVSRLDSVLTVPAAAIYEDGNRTYVYTACDEKTGEPASPVDVTTGASDGTNIQILSGLADGDTVYYHYADSIVLRLSR